jgi:hypothetical protein
MLARAAIVEASADLAHFLANAKPSLFALDLMMLFLDLLI